MLARSITSVVPLPVLDSFSWPAKSFYSGTLQYSPHTPAWGKLKLLRIRLPGHAGGAAPNMSRIAAILPAAGLGTRMGADTPKQFLELNGTPIVILSLRRIASCPLVTDLIVATRADEVQRVERVYVR